MTPDIFSKLFQRYGSYSLPVLVELRRPGMPSWHFTNCSEDVAHGGNLYRAVPMGYKPPSSKDGLHSGGSLEIAIDIQGSDGEELLRWFDLADWRAELIATAVVSDNGAISELGELAHRAGGVSWDGEKIVWSFGSEDRIQMQVNPWAFDADSLLC